MLSSTVCRHDHFLTDWYRSFAELTNFPVEVSPANPQGYRKVWEWAAILETLRARDMLTPGRVGMGFACGTEPLPAIMASHGVRVVATDLDLDLVDSGWVETNQHASNLDALYRTEMLEREVFDERVSFQPADMRDLPKMEEQFDFVWSSCAFEHLGTLSNGLDFVVNAMDLVKPGGIAVHTTEFNIVSNDETVTEGYNVLYRKRDFEELDARLRRKCCGLEAMDYDLGHHPNDLLFDKDPYYSVGRVHLKLEVDGYVCTSALLVIRKA